MPTTALGLKAQKPVDMIAIIEMLIREHYDVAQPFLAAMGGTGQVITGNPRGDEWYMVKELMTIATANGFSGVAAMTPDDFRRKARYAIRRVAPDGLTVGKLMKQGAHLRITQQAAE
jgi:hypothetical protein